ncbi:MAG: ImmA/IrrE family metallo-endopeptidase [Treponema sp.]|jgi:Zn-dependent peptidase ImmA (M78 family)|nr:ImmA/IrrE family metallo-endopeptidase [Treponema sp.]
MNRQNLAITSNLRAASDCSVFPIDVVKIVRYEIAANKFAAELLMPEAMVRSELEKYDDFIDANEDIVAVMAAKFNVSTTAMGFRIQNLGYSWP